jgi:hypothetical protein
VGNKEKKEVKKGGAPLSFSEMAKRPGNPQPVRRIPFPEKTIAQTNRPRAFFKVRSGPMFIFFVGTVHLQHFSKLKVKRSRNQGFAYYPDPYLSLTDPDPSGCH